MSPPPILTLHDAVATNQKVPDALWDLPGNALFAPQNHIHQLLVASHRSALRSNTPFNRHCIVAAHSTLAAGSATLPPQRVSRIAPKLSCRPSIKLSWLLVEPTRQGRVCRALGAAIQDLTSVSVSVSHNSASATKETAAIVVVPVAASRRSGVAGK